MTIASLLAQTIVPGLLVGALLAAPALIDLSQIDALKAGRSKQRPYY